MSRKRERQRSESKSEFQEEAPGSKRSKRSAELDSQSENEKVEEEDESDSGESGVEETNGEGDGEGDGRGRPWFGSPCAATKSQKSVLPCENAAKWWWDEKAWCAVHCKKKDREELEHNPKEEELKRIQKQEEHAAVLSATRSNAAQGQPGNVIMHRMRMRRKVAATPGFLQVFPNFRGSSKALSPMVCVLLSSVPCPLSLLILSPSLPLFYPPFPHMPYRSLFCVWFPRAGTPLSRLE